MRVKIAQGFMPQNVEMPEESEKFKRSCKGSLHLKPGTVRELTDDEFAVLKKDHKDIVQMMHVMPVRSPKSAPAPSVAPKPTSEKSPKTGKSSSKKDTATK